jgi:serine/threonine protein kinase
LEIRMESSIESFCSLVVRARLLTPEEIKIVQQRWQHEAGDQKERVSRFGDWLVANRYLTAYQAERLVRGKTDHFFFNDYKLLDRIGVGRMAGVFKAVHRLGQVVAIKVLPPSRVKDPQAFGRFQREARLALRLKHPNLVRTFQTGECDKIYYLVMEYLDGETLEEVLRRRQRLPVEEAVRLVHQALLGLQHLYEKGIVHRDLKPANLMLVTSELDTTLQATVKILDIGVARSFFDENAPAAEEPEALTNKGELLGSPDYLAPEQARDAHAADIRADIYSLGCVLYHCLTGQPPFADGNAVQKIVKHATVRPQPLRSFDSQSLSEKGTRLGVASPFRTGFQTPEGLQPILDRMLAKSPSDRYTIPSKAARALEGFLKRQQEPAATEAMLRTRAKMEEYEAWLAAHDPEVHAALKRTRQGFVQRHARALLAGAAGLILLLLGILIAGGVYLRQHPQPERPDARLAYQPLAEQKEAENRKAAFDTWLQEVAALPVDQQAAAVDAKLKDLNPDFRGPIHHKTLDGAVTELEFVSDGVTDLAPVRALSGLRRLDCAGSSPGKSRLASLEPLRGLSLTVLNCSSTAVSDLRPLRGMSLIFVGLAATEVRDLSPLGSMPLMALNCAGTHVRDLAPLQGMALTILDAADTPVADLSPLKNMPLEALWGPIQPARDAALIRSLALLKEVNGKLVASIRKQAETEEQDLKRWAQQVAALPAEKQIDAVAVELKKRNPGFNGKPAAKVEQGAVVELQFVSDAVTDLAPLRALRRLQRLYCPGSQPGQGQLASLQALAGIQLTEFDCGWTQVRDLSPLEKMPLVKLSADGNPGITDLTPLCALPLTHLSLRGTHVHDLAPLRGRPLIQLDVADTHVHDLTPLRDLALTSLTIHNTPVIDLSPLARLPLKTLSCDFKAERDASILAALKSLQKMNNRPIADGRRETGERVKAFNDYLKNVAALPADKQLEAVVAELKRRNDGFDGNVESQVDFRGGVSELTLSADQITDLFPVRALVQLKKLTCKGSAAGKGKLRDLSPLKGLALKELLLSSTAVADLTPLAGMASLTRLDLANTPVLDLAALRKKPLRNLDITSTKVTDLRPLKDLPLTEIYCDPPDDPELDLLRGIKSLVKLNGQLLKDAAPAPVRLASAEGAGANPAQRLVPTTRFQARLHAVHRTQRELVVRLQQAILVQNDYHTSMVGWHLYKLREAAFIRDPRTRIRRMQEELYWIAVHRAQMYHWHHRNHDVVIAADEEVQVRVQQLPPAVDALGKPRPYTPEELKDLKGPDPRVPGYRSSFDYLSPGQVVDLFIARASVTKLAANDKNPPGEKGVDPRPRVMLIVIL